MTPERLRPHLEAWMEHGGSGRVHVVHLDGPWAGAEQLLVGDQYVDVRVCPSELAVREELTHPRPSGRTTVLLCPVELRGADLLARIAKRRVLRLHAWDAVPHLFGVRQIDPILLKEKWMAEALVEAAPVGGYERSAAQALDADRAWRALLRHRHGIDVEGGLGALMTWAGGPDAMRLTERSAIERDAVVRRLESTIDGSAPVLALATVGKGSQAWPLGLAVRVLLDGPAGEARAASRTLLSVMLGGWAFDNHDARAWARASEDHVTDLLARDAPAGQATLQAADRAIASLQAEPLVGVSDLVTAGLQARLRDLASALARRGAEQAAPGEVEQAAQRVRRHRLEDHHALATMVTRLTRWLDLAGGGGDDFRALAQAHVTDQAYVDWARTTLRVATGEPTLDEQLRALIAEADARRREQDLAFATRLASYVGHAAAGGLVLGVEEVLDRVVAPIAKQRPVMLLVLDGMSHRVACELMEDIVARGWIELRPPEEHTRTLVLSALPSVTAFSRTSLLSGTLVKGAAPDESKAFAAHGGLVAASSRGGAPLLFHKGALKDPHGGLAAELRSELAGDRRIVAAVVNAIDDHLAKDDQLAAPWSATYVPLLRLLLDEARNATRIVILASDHGHVLDHGGQSRNGGPEHGERYRSTAQAAGDGEQLVEGARVLAAGGRCVLAVDEGIRYSNARKHGYHGGGSPQEVLAPLLVLAPGLADGLDGWVETGYDPPAWWTGQAVPEPAVQVAPASPVEEPSGQLILSEQAAAAAGPAWIAELLGAETFAAQRAAASRSQVPEERVVAILVALNDAGGKLLQDALARRVNIAPVRLRGTLAVMRQLLNVDGYPVLSVDEDTGDVVLDVGLLREQFGLRTAG
jgi:PglZ domain